MTRVPHSTGTCNGMSSGDRFTKRLSPSSAICMASYSTSGMLRQAPTSSGFSSNYDVGERSEPPVTPPVSWRTVASCIVSMKLLPIPHAQAIRQQRERGRRLLEEDVLRDKESAAARLLQAVWKGWAWYRRLGKLKVASIPHTTVCFETRGIRCCSLANVSKISRFVRVGYLP